MIQKLADISAFLSSANPIFDVRAPQEYQQGHIPGALMFPLFNDEERALVGTLYHRQGKEEAVAEGMKIVGPRMHHYVEEALRLAPGKKVNMYCWRGGMRSGSLAFLLDTAGFEVFLLKDGYKAYRRYVRESFNENRSLMVLGGYTGSGKTEILHLLHATGNQVLDLENHASHKGSIFGGIGQEVQPTNEQFENNLHHDWMRYDPAKPLWVEDESYEIGRISLPNPLFAAIKQGNLLKLVIPAEVRAVKLAEEYGKCDPQLLETAFLHIEKKLGNTITRKAIAAIHAGNFAEAARISLAYYDEAYDYSLRKRELQQIVTIESPVTDPIHNHALINSYLENPLK
jgi:tRNA 2-selenouridine synthase